MYVWLDSEEGVAEQQQELVAVIFSMGYRGGVENRPEDGLSVVEARALHTVDHDAEGKASLSEAYCAVR